jgi:hypothetical protein
MKKRWNCTAVDCGAEATTGWITSGNLVRLICRQHLDQLADGGLGIAADDGSLIVKPLAQHRRSA